MTDKRPPLSNFRVDELGIEVRHAPSEADVRIDAKVLAEIGYHEFDRCPICLAPGPTDREHLPPESMGGIVRTRTCVRCNNQLGSRVEDQLRSWYEDELRQSSFSSPESGVPGRRAARRVFYRTTPTGEFVLSVMANKADPNIRQMLKHGKVVEYEYVPPDPRRYRIAALKQAYLAACLQLQEIPQTESAEAIRRDLIAARDAPDSRSVPASAIADALTVVRSFEVQKAPPLALCKFRSTADVEKFGISLAGSILVSWPFSDVSPAEV